MMERRYFLLALACGVAVVRLPGEHLMADFSDWHNMMNIHPGGDIRQLADHYRVFHSDKGPDTLLSRYGSFSQAVARDFEGGWVVRIDGWLYSRTELYLCALKVGLLNQILES